MNDWIQNEHSYGNKQQINSEIEADVITHEQGALMKVAAVKLPHDTPAELHKSDNPEQPQR
jgi:hypothetical protein